MSITGQRIVFTGLDQVAVETMQIADPGEHDTPQFRVKRHFVHHPRELRATLAQARAGLEGGVHIYLSLLAVDSTFLSGRLVCPSIMPVSGQVRWRRGGIAGIEFDQPLSVGEMFRGAAGQQDIT